MPSVFEFPHYAGSAVDYSGQRAMGKRYDRGLYFPGVLTGAKIDYTRQSDSSSVHRAGRLRLGGHPGEHRQRRAGAFTTTRPAAADLLASAGAQPGGPRRRGQLLLHPYLGTDYLKDLVTGIKAQGYTFVSGTRCWPADHVGTAEVVAFYAQSWISRDPRAYAG
ncbi:hypothetical protein GCM10020358_23020 [Amorphoplanes nipponensis]|uniref:hypothetical protein n=1 Tax=Actinoplanes nipponensis TaxID=135950 RepID=UPI0031E84473